MSAGLRRCPVSNLQCKERDSAHREASVDFSFGQKKLQKREVMRAKNQQDHKKRQKDLKASPPSTPKPNQDTKKKPQTKGPKDNHM